MQLNPQARSETVASVPSVAAAGPEERAAVLTLDNRGMICDCNRSAETLFMYRRSEMVWRHVSMLLPQLAELDLMPNGQPNPRLRFLCRIGRAFQAFARNGERFASDLFFNVLRNSDQGRLLLIVRPVEEMSTEGLWAPPVRKASE
jgi:hypothetical protein